MRLHLIKRYLVLIPYFLLAFTFLTFPVTAFVLTPHATEFSPSTYFGGSGDEGSWAVCLEKGSDGSIYIAGITTSNDLPTTKGAYDESYNGSGDIFIAKFDSELKKLLASTYIGGSGEEWSVSMTMGMDGNLIFSTTTKSQDFPTSIEAYDRKPHGDYDLVIFKMDPGLTNLQASTYLGGSKRELGALKNIASDLDGKIFVTATSESSDFPTTTGAYDTILNGSLDAVVVKLDSNLSRLLSSTFIGSFGADYSYGILYDPKNGVYITGHTASQSFPTTTGVYDPTINGGDDVFISCLDPDLKTLVTSTFIGGSKFDNTCSIKIDIAGNIYIAGHTASANYPTTEGAYQRSYKGGPSSGDGGDELFISKLSGDLSKLLASTFLGGTGEDYQPYIILEGGDVYVSAEVGSNDFPITSETYQMKFGGGKDYILSHLSGDLNRLVASTFIGGSNEELFGNIMVNSNAVYAVGSTGSNELKISPEGYQSIYKSGKFDVFLIKLNMELKSPVTNSPPPQSNSQPQIPGFPGASILWGLVLIVILLQHKRIPNRSNL